MRSYFPVSSQESKVELEELQEHLIRLLGYDVNVSDHVVDREGSLDTLESAIDASGLAMMDYRLYATNRTPLYAQFYRACFINDINRGKYV